MLDPPARKRRSWNVGESNPKAKLNWVAVREIRQLSAEGVRQVELAARYGVAQETISQAVKGVTWKEEPDENLSQVQREEAEE